MRIKVFFAVLLLMCLSTVSMSAQCTTQALPYVESFDNLTSLSPCFMTQNASLSNAYSYSTPKSVKLSPNMTGGAYIVFPAVAANASALECYFKIRGGSNEVNYYVGIVPDTSDLSSFMPIYTGSVQGTTWQDVEFNTMTYPSSTTPTFICIYAMDGVSEDIYIDDMDIHALPSCVRPTNVQVTASGMYDVTFGWTAGASETQWSVTYQVLQGATTVASGYTTTAQPQLTVNGLTPSTSYTYNVSLRALCSATDSSLARIATGTFSTSCMIISTFPYTEDFESDFSVCHNLFNGCTYNWCSKQLSRSTTMKHGGSYSLKGPGGDTDATTDDYPTLALPQMNFTDPNGYTVKFWMYRDASEYSVGHWANEGFRIYTSSRNDNLTDTTFLGFISCSKSVAPTETSVGWYQYQFEIPATVTGLNYVLIVFDSEYGRNGYIDDITVEVTAGCRKITATAENVRSTTADIVSSDANVTSWQIMYWENAASNTPVLVTSSAVRQGLTGLTQNTQYVYQVRRICGVGDTSDWSTVQTFRTTELADTLPFITGFENNADDYRWTMTTEGWSNFVIGTDPNAVYAGSRALYVSTNGSTYGYATGNNYASVGFASRMFHFDGDEYTISFRWKCTGGEMASGGFVTIYDFGRIFLVPGTTTLTGSTNGQTYASYDGNWPAGMIPIEPSSHAYYCLETTGDANGWNYMSYDINMVGRSGDYKLVFMWNNDFSGGTQYPLAIDELSISGITCPRPNTIVSQLTSSSAALLLNGAASYRVVVSSQPIADAENPTGDIMDTTITSGTLNLSGLTENTTYYYTARGYCATGDTSGWSVAASFTTECLSNMPYSESFEQATVLDCWSQSEGTALSRSNKRAHQGLRSMYVSGVTAISPELDLDTMARYTLTGWVYSEAADVLNVGVIVDPTDGSTGDPAIVTVNVPANTWTEFTAPFTLLYDPEYSDFVTARHFILSMANGTAFNVDQLYLSTPTVCGRPTNPVITDTVHNGFQMTWTDGVAAEWIVRVTDTLNTVYTYIVDTQYVNVTDLEEQMVYSVEVAAICGVGDTSIYTSCGVVKTPVYVPTCADPAAAPTINATTATTMTVTANGNYMSYEFLYGTSATRKNNSSVVASATDRAVITGLAANSTYYVWFRGVCEPGDTSRWSAAAQGQTTYNDFFMPQNLHVVGVAEATSTTIAWGGAPEADKYEFDLVGDSTGDVMIDTLVFTHLAPAMTYTIKVRGIKSSQADTTAWSTLTFKTIAIPATTPYFCDFETVSENDNWMFENGNQTNHFMIGTSFYFDQTATTALFVTGTDSNAVYKNVPSTVYATRTLNLNAGSYQYSYNWVCAGEPGYVAGTAYDFPRVFLAPATKQFTAGSNADSIGYGFSAIPDGCIAMDLTQHLTQALSSRKEKGTLQIAEAGLYNIVIFWTNDDGIANEPAITVDSISFSQMVTGDNYTDTICYGTDYTQHGFNVYSSNLNVGVNYLSRTAAGMAGAPDTLYTATVTVLAPIQTTLNDTINFGEDYTRNGFNLSTPQTGVYSRREIAANGCDSTIYVNLQVIGGPTEVENVSDIRVDIVPNPVNAGMTALVYGNFGEVKMVQILNAAGQVIDAFQPTTYPIEVSGITATGIYYVRLTTEEGNVHIQKLIVR